MKYLRIFLCICILSGLGFLLIQKSPDTQWQGEVSASMQQFYNLKKAEVINSGEIKIMLDDTEILTDSSQQLMYMSEQLSLMVSPEVLAKVLDLTIAAEGDDSYQISNGDRTYRFTLHDDVVEETEDSFYYPESITEKNGELFIALEAVCLAFEHGYMFEMKDHSAVVVRTDPADETLPERYDMRSDGRAPAVGSQGSLGTCWAFAAVAAMESALLPEEHLRFSVDHLSLNNGFSADQDSGGDYYMALSYLASWKGPVYAADDPYGDGFSDASLNEVKHLQEAVLIRSKDYASIKRMVYEAGAVQSSFYSDIEYSNVGSEYYNIENAAYYYPGEAVANHDIVIVGWDDNYPKENFNFKPEKDGAFLCQNSWGNGFGYNGYFYISYEDTNIGVYNMVYTSLEDADNYDNIYQSDDLGWLGNIGYNAPSAWFANIYTADAPQTLSAVSFYATAADTFYEIYIVDHYINEDSLNDAVFVNSGYLEYGGYYTVPLEEDILVHGPFAVVIYIETKDAIHPVAIEYDGGEIGASVRLEDGQGYISHNGRQWQRAENTYDCNICLKAFTNDTVSNHQNIQRSETWNGLFLQRAIKKN